ncbi:acid phosphatase/vanadium-dependent haloperoxidase-related protein [Tanacetum coccineum]
MVQRPYVSDKREGIKRSAGGDIAPTTRHYRRVSIDSAIGNALVTNPLALDKIETLVYASQRHLQHLENGSRAGFFLEMELMYKEHRWDLDQLIGSGGMPHFATVTALAVAAMYDATGVRLHAGRQAEVVNQIVFELPAQHSLAEQAVT